MKISIFSMKKRSIAILSAYLISLISGAFMALFLLLFILILLYIVLPSLMSSS